MTNHLILTALAASSLFVGAITGVVGSKSNIEGEDTWKNTYTIKGVAITTGYNRDGGRIHPSAFKGVVDANRQIPLLSDHCHDSSGVLGKITKLTILDDKVLFEAELTRTEDNAVLVDKILRGYIAYVSVGFFPEAKDRDGIVTDLDLIEISIVPMPSYRDSKITEIKRKTK